MKKKDKNKDKVLNHVKQKDENKRKITKLLN